MQTGHRKCLTYIIEDIHHAVMEYMHCRQLVHRYMHNSMHHPGHAAITNLEEEQDHQKCIKMVLFRGCMYVPVTTVYPYGFKDCKRISHK